MYEKHGCDFLWGDAQYTELTEPVQNPKFTYVVVNTYSDGTGTAIPDDEVKEPKDVTKKALKEETEAMVLLKRSDKRRYENLQISLLKIIFAWGK